MIMQTELHLIYLMHKFRQDKNSNFIYEVILLKLLQLNQHNRWQYITYK